MLDHWVQRAEQGFDQEADVALFPGVDFEDRRIAEAMVGEFALIVLDGRHVAQVGTGDAEHDASLFDKAAECLDEERQVVDRIGAHVVEQQDESDAAFRQNVPHEVKAFLARRAVQVNRGAVGQADLAVIHRHCGFRLALARHVAGCAFRAHRLNVAQRADRGSFSGTDRAGENDLVVAHGVDSSSLLNLVILLSSIRNRPRFSLAGGGSGLTRQSAARWVISTSLSAAQALNRANT